MSVRSIISEQLHGGFPRGAKHIFIFIESLAGGGVERVALRLAALWAQAGRRVSLVAGSLAGPLVVELPAGVDVVELGTARYGALAIGVIGAIARMRPDVIFCPGNYYSAIAVGARMALGRSCPPIVCKISNAFLRRDFQFWQQAGYAAWLRFHAPWIDRFVAMSDAMREEAVAVAGIAPPRIETIPNPLLASRAPLEAAGDRPLVLGVGRLFPQKRFHKLVEAFAAVESPDAELVILGDGPERGRISDAAERLGIAARVRLPGYAIDPLPWMASARVLALSSAFEGVPNVLREALSVGTPVVTTACSSAIGHIVTDARLGSIVPIDDMEALARAIGERLAVIPDRVAIAEEFGLTDGGRPELEYLRLMDELVEERSGAL